MVTMYMSARAALLVLLLAVATLAPSTALRWHKGCMCELRPEAVESNAASDAGKVAKRLSPTSLFGVKHFRHKELVNEFCPCSIDSVQALNRDVIGPALEQLLGSTFFRYYRVDLDAECPFWHEDGYCTIRDCGVDEEAPAMAAQLTQIDHEKDHDRIHDSWPTEADSSWTNEDENTNFHFVDLLRNPEHYTGYRREAGASHVWHEVHAYNTFHSAAPSGEGGNEETEASLEAMPVEHRLFYKVVSGMHTSVSSHIAANYLLDHRANLWGIDLDQYDRRVARWPERLHNLYFAYLLVLHAVDIAGDYVLHHYDLSTPLHPEEDELVVAHLGQLLATRAAWPLSFDQEHAFASASSADHAERDAERNALLATFRGKLYNISRIMDCVGCQRCRLWGKLQVMGYGVALRLLYAPDRELVLQSLQRNHVVALFNLLGRLSHSVEVARVLVPLLQHADDRDGTGMRTGYGKEQQFHVTSDGSHASLDPFAGGAFGL